MKENKNALVLFIALTFGLSWAILLPAVFGNAGNNELLMAMVTFVPGLVAVSLTCIKGGREALKALLKKGLRVRIGFAWYAFALLLMPAVLFIAFFFANRFMGLEFNSVLVPIISEAPWAIVLVFLYLLALQGPLGEEFGWRGYALDKLLYSHGLIKASLILGLLWSAWHLPKFFIDGSIQHQVVSQGLVVGFAGYTVYTILLSLLLSVLHVRTGGSVLAAILMHTAANFSHGLVTIITAPSGALAMLAVLSVVTYVVLKANRDILTPLGETSRTAAYN